MHINCFPLAKSRVPPRLLEPILSELLRSITRFLGLCNPCNISLLLSVIRGRFRLSPLFKFCHRRLVFPPILNNQHRSTDTGLVGEKGYLRGDSSHGAVLPSRFQSQHPQGLRNNHPLLLVVWWRDTIKDLQSLQCCFAAFRFARDHSSNSFIKDP